MKYDREYSTIKDVPQSLAKDVNNKKITGVCAGIAKHFNFSPLAVRVVAVALLIAIPVVTAVVYISASLLLPSKYY
ncbi:PspC domain-containing protein [Colwellia sp. E2M01]|uniref:PspC domain-containing protein n=1 Tax=Colwellia sp. E2M01 TaxID=2841561 RepID=UPI001C095036|nr:PspC domain-containing protein [Colwellia sp. E2M01]MBU2871012.1 PspC domain-containing protein [Colwellia sp. E2M01]